MKYIRRDLWVPRKGPAHSQRILLGLGCLVTLADWVSRVKKGSGTGRRNQITPIDHLHCVRSSESRGRGHKIKALPSCLRGGYYAHKGAERDMASFVWLLGLTSHTAHHSMMLQLLTVASDVIVIEAL